MDKNVDDARDATECRIAVDAVVKPALVSRVLIGCRKDVEPAEDVSFGKRIADDLIDNG